jgi:hypothetical protein
VTTSPPVSYLGKHIPVDWPALPPWGKTPLGKDPPRAPGQSQMLCTRENVLSILAFEPQPAAQSLCQLSCPITVPFCMLFLLHCMCFLVHSPTEVAGLQRSVHVECGADCGQLRADWCLSVCLSVGMSGGSVWRVSELQLANSLMARTECTVHGTQRVAHNLNLSWIYTWHTAGGTLP